MASNVPILQNHSKSPQSRVAYSQVGKIAYCLVIVFGESNEPDL